MPSIETSGPKEEVSNQVNSMATSPDSLKVNRGLNEVPISTALTTVPAGDDDPEASQATERDDKEDEDESDDASPNADAQFEEVKL